MNGKGKAMWTSDRQRRWGNSPAGREALGQSEVDKRNADSKGMSLPETARAHMTKKHSTKKRQHKDNLDKVADSYMTRKKK